jgi:hypothetical protein
MKLSISLSSILLFFCVSPALGAELSDAFAPNRHPICGSHSYFYRFQATNPSGRPSKVITYNMFAPKICRHRMFGLAGTYEQTPSGIRVNLPGMPDEYRVAVEFINEIAARHVFNAPAYGEYGVPLCVDDPNYPGIPSAECLAAIAQLQRNDLLRIPRIAALEILDRFLGSANYKDPAIVARVQTALASVKAVQKDLSPEEVVRLLGLSDNAAQITPPRLEQFLSLPGSSTQKITLKVTSPESYAVRFEGTVTVLLDNNAKSSALRIDQGRVFWHSFGSITNENLALNSVGVDWCNGPAGTDKGNFTTLSGHAFGFPLISGLEEQIGPDREVRMDGLTAALPLPPSDLRLENHWLCIQMWNLNGRSLASAHSQDALSKGCKGNCL